MRDVIIRQPLSELTAVCVCILNHFVGGLVFRLLVRSHTFKQNAFLPAQQFNLSNFIDDHNLPSGEETLVCCFKKKGIIIKSTFSSA